MKKTIIAALFAALLLNVLPKAGAWSSPGHMVIASVAYRELSDAEKTTVNELLTHHPNYAAWKNSYQAGGTLDLETFIFMRASTWPDEIRNSGSQYDHPNWHFIDYPLKPSSFPVKPDASPNDNVLYGIAQCEEMLQDPDAAADVRAVHLSWLIHLVGDIHQPLHCATLVTKAYPAPVGDRGGNLFYVRPATKGVKLHSVWDQSLGSAIDFKTQYDYATLLRSNDPRTALKELSQATTPDAWSLESRAVAVDKGYLSGKLQGSKTAGGAVAPPADYTANLKTVAEYRAALAGYRLADEIAANVK